MNFVVTMPPRSPVDAACFFREASAGCGDLGELSALIRDACHALGFEHFALIGHGVEREGKPRLRIDNYPAPWVERLRHAPACAIDPVHEASRVSGQAFWWSAIGSLVRLKADQRRAMEEARGHGLGFGLTVPAHVHGHGRASCSLVSGRPVAMTQERMLCAEAIAHHGYRAALRLTAPPRQLPHLGRRERQCIALVARGKSDWEIGRILGLSRETVRSYLKQARARLDVVSRTQLAVIALRDGHIDFD